MGKFNSLNDLEQLRAIIAGQQDTIAHHRLIESMRQRDMESQTSLKEKLEAARKKITRENKILIAEKEELSALGNAQSKKIAELELINQKLVQENQDFSNKINKMKAIEAEQHAKILEIDGISKKYIHENEELFKRVTELSIIEIEQREKISGLETTIDQLADELVEIAARNEKELREISIFKEEILNKINSAATNAAKIRDVSTTEEEITAHISHSIYAEKRLKQVTGNYRIFRDTADQIVDEIVDLDNACMEMRSDLAKADAIYQPSEFWETFYKHNMRQLREVGLSNLKLTVNQNYQNYIPRTLRDPKLKPLLRLFKNSRSLKVLLSHLENPDKITDKGYLAIKGTEIFNDDPKQMAIYRTLVALGWDYCRANDPLNLCAQLAEPELGNPIRVHYGDKLISQDLATSVVEMTHFLKPWRDKFGEKPFRVLEVGGGYGRLAHAILSTQKVSQYFIVDIPPALHVSKWYLSQLFPEKATFDFRPFSDWREVKSEIEKADIVFLLPHQIEAIADQTIDISVAVSTLHEMRLDQANHFLSQMGRVSKHLIGSKNYWNYVNPYDNIVLKQGDYIVPDNFRSASLIDDPLNPVFFIDTMERTG